MAKHAVYKAQGKPAGGSSRGGGHMMSKKQMDKMHKSKHGGGRKK